MCQREHGSLETFNHGFGRMAVHEFLSFFHFPFSSIQSCCIRGPIIIVEPDRGLPYVSITDRAFMHACEIYANKHSQTHTHTLCRVSWARYKRNMKPLWRPLICIISWISIVWHEKLDGNSQQVFSFICGLQKFHVCRRHDTECYYCPRGMCIREPVSNIRRTPSVLPLYLTCRLQDSVIVMWTYFTRLKAIKLTKMSN